MKHMPLTIAFILFAFPVVADDTNNVARQYINYFSKGYLEKASKLMACPDSYSEEQIKNERRANRESLQIFKKEFGKIKRASISHMNSYITAMTACGDIEFLRKNHPFRTIVFKVKYENNGAGYIVLGFSGATTEAKLITVSHGLSALEPGAKEKVTEITNKLATKR
ncbi:MAG: hypothetical protein SV201_07080 [Pseudomonadota bacterium]|nr:hypothetical protein [Pseudomonadota bacterium]